MAQVPTRVHCFFEQSGTFKNEFLKLGIPAEDYDIQNNFGQTDHVVDLFAEIEAAYENRPSVFDEIKSDDLIMAFFPCIYFSCLSQMAFSWTCKNYKNKTTKEATDLILKRSKNREYFFRLAVKMLAVAKMRGLQMVMENPWSIQTFLKANFVAPPTMIDNDRTKRGDVFKKPTAYWFVNYEPTTHTHTHTHTPTPAKDIRKINNAKKAPHAGLCSEARSMISPDYARNFICDFILGKTQENKITELYLNF